MANPNIVPAWTADATYAVTDTDFLAVGVRLEDLDSEPAEIEPPSRPAAACGWSATPAPGATPASRSSARAAGPWDPSSSATGA